MFPLPLHLYFEIAALLVSLVFVRQLASSKFFWLPWFLAFIVTVEITGRYMNRVLHVNNAWLYNITVPVEAIVYFLVFYLHFSRTSFKNIALGFIAGIAAYTVFVLLFVKGIHEFNFDILKIGSSCTILLCLLYFIELIRSEQQVQLLRDPMFWFATGLFLFNVGEFLYALFADYINQYSDRTVISIFISINNKLIWVLYSCIILTIVCISRRYRKA